MYVMGGSALGPRPPPQSKVDRTLGAWRPPLPTLEGGQGARVAPPGPLSDFRMTPTWRHDLMMAPCAPMLLS